MVRGRSRSSRSADRRSGLQCRLPMAKSWRDSHRFVRSKENPMAEYIPSPRDWVREQVELYEKSGGTQGTTLRDTGLPVILVTHIGNKTGAIRKTPLMRVKDGNSYVLIGSQRSEERRVGKERRSRCVAPHES